MEHNYIAREKDQNSITEYKKGIETETLDALVECYNGQVMCGILEVHQQALYLIALRQELKESPAYLLKHIMGLVGPIEVVDGNIGIKGIKPQGKPVRPTKAGPDPNNRNRPKGRSIEPRSRRKRQD